jgi:RecA/RadA recombinase
MARPKKSPDVPTFNLLNRSSSFNNAVKEALSGAAGKVRNDFGTGLHELKSNNTKIIPIPDFGFRYMLNTMGFRGGRILDIIGVDGIGKTSLVFTIMGWAMRVNAPCCYVETEGKPMDKPRILRCLHPNRQISETMFSTITFRGAWDLKTAVNELETFVELVRNPKSGEAFVPIEVPVVVALDTFSKLMSPDEISGYNAYGNVPEEPEEKKDDKKDKFKKKVKKEVRQALGGGQPMQHAKLAHFWTRRLPYLLNDLNVFLIVVRHQNEKVDMAGGGMGGGSMIPKDVSDLYNRTAIGGKSFNQSASYQVIVSKDKSDYAQIRGERKKVSQLARVSVVKNNYGPSDRKLRYGIMQEPRFDTETNQEQALNFAVGLPEVLSSTGMVGIRIKSANDVAVKELKLDSATPREVSAALHENTELMDSLCKRLGLHYADDDGGKVAPVNPIFGRPSPPVVEGIKEES